MRNVIVGIAAYFAMGGFSILREEGRRRYEDDRGIASAIMCGASLPLLTVSAAVLYTFCTAWERKLPALALAGVIVLAILLFAGAVVVELHNGPEQYSIRRRHNKYGLQYLSGALLLSAPAIALLGADIQTGSEIGEWPQTCVVFITLMFLYTSSTMLWKGGRCFLWACKNSGNLRAGSKDMKKLRQSIRR